VETLISDTRPDVVYLPAAFPNVDYCETHPIETYETNVRGVKYVAQAANDIGAKLIYFSSDYIFDGQAGPYEETGIANPISEYGRQKLSAEHHIALFAKNFLIIRTTVVYGWEPQGKNFVYRIVKSLNESNHVKVPTDQVGTPTYASDLVRNVIRLSKTDITGIVNVAGPSCISRYDFALLIANIFSLPQNLIHPVRTKELNQSARRPLLAGLITEKAQSFLQTSFMAPGDGLQTMRDQQDLL
jgi:dTDP-4-dehydrorhamnose reductase